MHDGHWAIPRWTAHAGTQSGYPSKGFAVPPVPGAAPPAPLSPPVDAPPLDWPPDSAPPLPPEGVPPDEAPPLFPSDGPEPVLGWPPVAASPSLDSPQAEAQTKTVAKRIAVDARASEVIALDSTSFHIDRPKVLRRFVDCARPDDRYNSAQEKRLSTTKLCPHGSREGRETPSYSEAHLQ